MTRPICFETFMGFTDEKIYECKAKQNHISYKMKVQKS